jgi:hypothetical protein
MTAPIRLLGKGIDVARAVAEIEAQPDVWNRHELRTTSCGTPHKDIPDIWVRYNAWENFTGDPAAFNGEHESSWYPVINQLPAVREIIFGVMHAVQGEKLGGVLITRVPPGKQVAPHADTGWHAQHYRKFAVQLKGNAKQAFHFEACSLVTQPGDLYTFDNSFLHWVTNDSDEDRITLIICIRGSAI